MGANIAGIYGAQIFRSDDKPLYRRGFSVACAVLAVGLAIAVFRFVDDVIHRRRKRNQEIHQAATADAGSAGHSTRDAPSSRDGNVLGDEKRGPLAAGNVLPGALNPPLR